MSEELLLLKISNIFSALQFEISSDDINVLSDSLFQVFDSGYVINYTDSYRIAHSLLIKGSGHYGTEIQTFILYGKIKN